MGEISKCVRLGVFFLLLCPATMQANDACNDFSPGYFGYHRDYYGLLYEEYPYYNSRYTDLYQKFEDALVNKSTLLGNLRVGFISKGDIPIHFRLKLELMNGTNINVKITQKSTLHFVVMHLLLEAMDMCILLIGSHFGNEIQFPDSQ
ncbi:hypothetical protein GBAR_LOCUS8096 [Geodia barretti]|uniref:Secreted protein n=1 Tax=Geodia barretti TaxID=519541 RepID=A0AA35RL96_GEOBA|nr:hypothetical protein GBAR_LOCUS8096 [Geodia barretti]